MFDNSGDGRRNELREWTLMFYFASDNLLSPGIVSQLKALKDAGFHHDANVVARFDPHTEEIPTHIFDVNLISKLRMKRDHPDKKSDVGFTANDPFVRNSVADKLWRDKDGADIGIKVREQIQKYFQLEGIDYNPPEPPTFVLETRSAVPKREPACDAASISTDPPVDRSTQEPGPNESLQNFLNFCKDFYPARHYILFILGHGVVVGNDIFLLDEHAEGDHAVTLKELGSMLTKFAEDIKSVELREKGEEGEFELVSFHSCSMSGLEVAYELKGSAKYMLASQGPAFVGSYPYKQILIRIFNDLNRSEFARADIKDRRGLAAKILAGDDPVTAALKKSFDDPELLDQISNGEKVDRDTFQKFIDRLNTLLETRDLYDKLSGLELQENTIKPIATHEKEKFAGSDLQLLNRQLIAEAFPEEIDIIRGMFSRIFDYCLFNSYDFQLAGYSFDLCLTDLRKLDVLKSAFDGLAEELSNALPIVGDNLSDEERLVLNQIRLAQVEAQSYFEENFIDLFDFCFCLHRQCDELDQFLSEKARPILGGLRDACKTLMDAFAGRESLIVRSEFAGPTYQYSNGLSIFFPWSAPIASDMWRTQYPCYKLIRDGGDHSWKEFLDRYFASGQRKTQAEEKSGAHLPVPHQNQDGKLLELMSRLVFNEFGQLKDDPNDRTDKDHKNDPTGDDCVCPSIKNYPPFTRARDVPTSESFFDRIKIL